MKERALEIVATRAPAADGVNVLREYLQSRVLGLMQAEGAFIPLAFMGGTALRFRYRIERYSEDLDFTLERDRESFDFVRLVDDVARGLRREGYVVDVARNGESAVKRAMIAFAGLLAEAGLAPHAGRKLKVRLEIDTNPPEGATFEVVTISANGPLRIQFHDLPSLFAGKTAAVLAHGYTKGRDLYDLAWYLSRDPAPEMNLALLKNTLRQTAPDLADSAVVDWRGTLRTRLEHVDWDSAWHDVAAFLESPARDRVLFSADAFESLLS